jgi:hypothetical protein
VIPSAKQFKNWSLPSKAGYISFCLDIVGLLLSAAFWTWPKSSVSDTDEYVRRTNPVKLSLKRVSVQRWLGDEQDALTVTVRNESKVPVDGVSFSLGDENRDVPGFSSNQLRKIGSAVSIDAGGDAMIPIAGISEIESVLRGRVCGAAVEHPGLGHSFPGCGTRTAHLNSYLFTLRLGYKTIFKEIRRDEFKFWVFFVVPQSAR